MLSEEEWRATDYFMDFRCKGGACRNSCCEGWEIAVGMKDYFDLLGMDCPDEIHHRIECAFRVPEEVSPEHYRMISPNWLGMCPLHDADGLCMIHRHCGEEHLPEVCRVYPRRMSCESGENRASCSGGCEAVVEALMRPDPLRIINMRMRAQPEYSETEAPDFPIRSRRMLELIQQRGKPLRDRLGKICTYIMEEAMPIPAASIEGALSMLMAVLQEIAAASASMGRFGAAALERYAGANAAQNYADDIAHLQGRFPAWEQWFENLLANHFFYACLPCPDGRISEEKCVHGICMLYGLLRTVSAAYLRDHPSQSDFADALAGVLRLVEHSAFYYNAQIMLRAPLELLTL